MATVATEARADHNSLGKASFIVGVIGLIFSFIPIIGFVSWLLGPLAIIFGLVALRKQPRSLAIAGLIAGAITMLVCFSWLNATSEVGKAMSADTFNTTGEARDMASAPTMDATVSGIWDDLESNKVAAGQKYGGNRLAFTDEAIVDFSGDAANPAIQFLGNTDGYMEYYVVANFAEGDGDRIATMSKGEKVSFMCNAISETFMEGYGLSDCTLN